MEFKEADKEFLPMAQELFEKHQNKLHLTVDPEEVMFLRSDSKRKAFAYCKRVTDEYVLLTDKKFFIVVVNKYFNLLKNDNEKRYVILHEMLHLYKNENDQYKLLDHNLKEFRELLKDPNWNLLLVNDVETTLTTPDGEVKIGLDFNFHDKEAMKQLREKLKEEKKEDKEQQECSQLKTEENGK